MKIMKSHLLAGIISGVLAICAVVPVYAGESAGGGSSESIIYIEDGSTEYLLVGCEPVFDGDDIFIPLKSFAVFIDYEFEETGNELYLSNGNRQIIVQDGSSKAVVDNDTVSLTMPIKNENDDFYAELNDIKSLFSYETEYDDDQGIIILTTTDETPEAIVIPNPPEETESPQEPIEEEEFEEEEESSDKSNVHTITVVSYGDDLSIYVDDVQVNFTDAQPFVDDEDRTQIPVRALAEILDCDVDWNQEKQLVTITSTDGTVIQMIIGDRNLIVDGTIVEMDSEALIIEDRTYIPMRFIAEALGLNVFWEWDE